MTGSPLQGILIAISASCQGCDSNLLLVKLISHIACKNYTPHTFSLNIIEALPEFLTPN